VLHIAVSLFLKDWPVPLLLLVLFLLLAIPVVVGIITWLRHDDQAVKHQD